MAELFMWTVYDKNDEQGSYRALEWRVKDGKAELAGGSMHAPTLDMIRKLLQYGGLYRTDRWPEDHPSVLETWF
jgi:hypothetical protein